MHISRKVIQSQTDGSLSCIKLSESAVIRHSFKYLNRNVTVCWNLASLTIMMFNHVMVYWGEGEGKGNSEKDVTNCKGLGSKNFLSSGIYRYQYLILS